MPTQEISNQRASSGHEETCVACGASLQGNVEVRLQDSQLRRCGSCGTWVHFPRPDPVKQAAIHDNEDYFDHPYFKLRRGVDQAQLRRCRQIFDRLSVAADIPWLRGRRLLDVGCDTGAFLSAAAKEFGIQPVGLDVGARSVAIAAERGIEVYQATIEQAASHLRDFAVITAIDLVEHVSDPASLLRQIRDRLCPGGVAYLETPNIYSAVYKIGRVLARVTGGRPGALYERLFPPQHIQYFTRTSLNALARACGLDLVHTGTRVLPWDDIASSLLVRTAMVGMQLLDRLTEERILTWTVLRRPA